MWPIVVALGLVAVVWVYNSFVDVNPVDCVEGPRRLPIIGCVLEFRRATPVELFRLMRELNKKFQGRYLIKVFGRRILHISSPDDIELVLSHSRNLTKSKPYRFMEPWLGTGLLLSTGDKWLKRRKILTPTFHFHILKTFIVIINEKTRNLISTLKQHQEIEVDLFPTITDYTLYTICETAMGTQLDHDKSAAAMAYKQAILEVGGLLLKRLTRSWLHPTFIFRRTNTGIQFNAAVDKIHRFADNVILERKKHMKVEERDEKEDELGSKKRLAMLDLLLEAESNGEIDFEGIREEVNTFMFEGHDTTAAAISFGLMLIADHVDVQDRIYEECRLIFGESDRAPGMAELADMKYLEAVIKEILRLYPSVPFQARKLTEDIVMGDILVKKGVEVAVHSYDLHRREELFPDPAAFKPDRFLDGTHRHPFAYIPFSAGPRNCIGQRFAMIEMKSVFSEICRNFRLQPKVQGWRPTLIADMVLRTRDKIYVKFIRR